jgi:hypothetical protein
MAVVTINNQEKGSSSERNYIARVKGI